MDLDQPKNILITGASSGIGAALARAYAAPGVTLHLGGRNQARLERIVSHCADLGARAIGRVQDVVDRGGMTHWIDESYSEGPLDLVIANAGISGGTGEPGIADGAHARGENPDQVREIMAVNVDGVINTVFPAFNRMLDTEVPPSGTRGQVAIMSSLAGFRSFPGAPAYCASKAAVRSLGEGLRGLMAPNHISVSTICPGFVKSPMTDANPYTMPLIMPSDQAAWIIKNGLARNRGRITFPKPLAAVVWLMTTLPPSWTDPLMRRLPEKPATE
jgi:NAD(P)-dependent dehydrogenase (short-subunit alcohol dehydrogenase family)